MREPEAGRDAGVQFERADAQDLEAGLHREWLLTNGLGGYASGTVPGVDTRHYHALLVAATHPPIQRMALLVRLNEAITVGEDTTELMTAEYRDGTISPDGFTRIESFALEDGLPTWHFRIGGSLLRRTIWMVPDHNITVVRYKLVVGREPVDLALRPLCAARDHHKVQRGDWNRPWSVETVKDGARVLAGDGVPPLWLLASGASFQVAGDWYWSFLLREERARGYDHIEDLFQPGTFHATLRAGRSLTFIASAEPPGLAMPDPDAALAARRSTHARITAAQAPGSGLDHLTAALQEAAAQFVVQRQATDPAAPARVSLIAGYPWFADYGRDSLISLPGVLLETERVAEAADLLRGLADHIEDGLIPSQFPDNGDPPEYTAADTSLLFFPTLGSTLAAAPNPALLSDLYPRLREIIDCYTRGTRAGIGVDPHDGLLRAGEWTEGRAPTRLTWMDARLRDRIYTPRVGKPVEVNALWIQALDLMADWAPGMGDDAAPYQRAAELARASFAQRFWNEEGGYLFDVIDGPDGDDSRLRPNQLFALARTTPLVSREQAIRALDAITQHLLTPYGLRTLSPQDPEYRGRCVGDQAERDSAYHQGTVWPWLLGPYVDAYLAVEGALPDLKRILEPFIGHLREAGLGTISQIFDGNPPHTPRGCIAQAWSVGELLRLARLAREA
ncbi:MAG TPA: amylo-alpha-1,6-glucosidase [Chloroflexota bacterium]|nr:amylo-alpha-1,6-glucosidase [Chloroflexota bacterium]